MCLLAKCVESPKKRKYSNLIREKNMIIVIDRGATRAVIASRVFQTMLSGFPL